MHAKLPLLSKSRYLAGVQCAKRLWLECHAPQARAEPTLAMRQLFAQGHEVGRLATLRYPDGVRMDDDPARHDQAVRATAVAMRAGAPAIFEAAFAHEGVRIRADILARTPRGWRLEEVKSSTSLKDVHLDDLAIQLHVLRGAGVPVNEAGITHLDPTYVRGAELDVHGLFRFVELPAAGCRDVAANLREWRRQLALDEPPAVAPGAQCEAPYECPFADHCVPAPGPYSVRRLPGYARLAAAAAVDDVRRLPADLPLTAIQARAVTALRDGREQVAPGVGECLDALRYPVHFLDFETFAPAIPRYRGTRPYQTLPFQWSNHVLASDGSLARREFLHGDDADPRRPFLDSLLAALGESGSIVVYSSYEQRQLETLARAFPEDAPRIERVLARLVDLLPIVRAHYYHPDMDGSFSLKAVAPVLAPELVYDRIAAGTEASAAYEELIAPATAPGRRAELAAELRRYCATDTLALVRVRQALLARDAGIREMPGALGRRENQDKEERAHG